MNNLGQPTQDEINEAFCDKCNAVTCAGCPVDAALRKQVERTSLALENLFQACSDLPLPEMDRMEKEINAASAALKQETKE